MVKCNKINIYQHLVFSRKLKVCENVSASIIRKKKLRHVPCCRYLNKLNSTALQSNRSGRLGSLTFTLSDDGRRKSFRKVVFSTKHNILKEIKYERSLSNSPIQKFRFLP